MKKTRVLLGALLGVVLGLMPVLGGCGADRDENELEITYYNGGYGSAWIENAKTAFEKANPGVTVTLKPDSSLQDSIGVYLESGKRLSDLYFTQSINWQYYVSQGMIEPLDDLYDTNVPMLDGTQKTIREYLNDDRATVGRMSEVPGEAAHDWILPWTTFTCGMVYNDHIIKNTPHRAECEHTGNWDKAPETMAELYEYVDDLNAAEMNNAAGTRIKPFAIGLQKGQWWLTFPLKVWWAQLQGVEEPSVMATANGQGSYYDFWDFGSPNLTAQGVAAWKAGKNVWNQKGIQGGLDILRSLLLVDGEYANCIDRCEQLESTEAEAAFAKGEAAFIFVGNWLENEIANQPKDENFTPVAMYVPTVDASVNGRTGVDYVSSDFVCDGKINNNAEMDLALIPSGAPNKDLAKKFLAFINSEEMLLQFTKDTGALRPFEYDPAKNETDGYAYSSFVKSSMALIQNADYNIIEYPMNRGRVPAEERDTYVSMVYTYKRPELFMGPGSGKCLGALKTKTGAEIMKDVIEHTDKEYERWLRNDIGVL